MWYNLLLPAGVGDGHLLHAMSWPDTGSLLQFQNCRTLWWTHGMTSVFLFWVLIVLIGSAQAAESLLESNERDALCDLYVSTDGANWLWDETDGSRWNCTGNSDPCEDGWQGVYCDNATPTKHVTGLDLEYSNMRGTLPFSLGNLTYLSYMDLFSNEISGSIPTSFYLLTELTGLGLGDNAMTGTLPAYFGNLSNMEYLLFYDNYFTGTLPAAYVQLPVLTELNVDFNQLSGTLPREINAPLLGLCGFSDNFFSGTIPAEFGNFANATELLLSDNLLTGTIPASLGDLHIVQVLMLSNNSLTGTVPMSLGGLSSMVGLYLSFNALTGTIPDNFVFARRLQLQNNRFTGSLPPSMINWVEVTQLQVSCNHLTGQLPPGLDAWQQLTFLYVDGNHLTGTIPPELGAVPLLVSLNLSYNHFTGSIPRSFANLTDLAVLLLHSNALTGTLDGLFNATAQHNFTAIQVSDNQLTGQIPEEIFRLPQLSLFAAVSNCFDGAVPLTICNSTTLVTAALDGLQSATNCRNTLLPGISTAYTVRNGITQGVPACLFQMKKLATLHLSGNGLTGGLPDADISPVLTSLSLSHNYLRGSIPYAFQHHNWDDIDLSYNLLSGSLQSDFAAHENTSISLEENRLSGEIPPTLREVQDVSVLGSNLFSCGADRSDLPDHNQDRDKYQCGSTSFNAGAYAWIGLAAIVSVCVVLVVVNRDALGLWVDRWLMPKKMALWWSQGNAYPNSGTGGGGKSTAPRFFAEVCALCQLLSKLGAAAAVVAAIVLLPMYGALSHFSGTLLHQYAWTVSAAFLSGKSAFAVLFITYALVPVAFVVLFLHLQRQLLVRGAAAEQRSLSQMPAASTSPTVVQQTRVDAVIPTKAYAIICAAFVAFNFTITSSVNVAYVFTSLYADESVLIFVQLLLSVFKLGFNRFCAPHFLRYVGSHVLALSGGADSGEKPVEFHPSQFMSVQLLVVLVNNIIIPCLVVGAVSPGCFVHIFQSAPTVSSTFTYNGDCIGEAQANYDDDRIAIDCVRYSLVEETTTYNPPFQYSYQCSSSIITYYAPAMLNVCLLATFAGPIGQVIGQQLHQRAPVGSSWRALLSAVVPKVLQPLPPADNVRPSPYTSYSAAHLQLLSLLNYLGLLLTFGVVFPPLAVTFAVAIAASYAHTRLKVGRFLCLAQDAGRGDCAALIEEECEGVGNEVVLRRAVRMLVAVSCLFYAMFLFDTLGDKVGFKGAFWVLIVMPLLPVCYLAGYQIWLRAAQQAPLESKGQRELAGAAVEEAGGLSRGSSSVSFGRAPSTTGEVVENLAMVDTYSALHGTL